MAAEHLYLRFYLLQVQKLLRPIPVDMCVICVHNEFQEGMIQDCFISIFNILIITLIF
jgi:hypothetical protein